MGTYAILGRKNTDGSVTSVRTLSDGYFSFTAPKLHQFYNTQEKVDKLVMNDVYQVAEDTHPIYPGDEHFAPITYEGQDAFFDSGYSHQYLYKEGRWFYRQRCSEGQSPVTALEELLIPKAHSSAPLSLKIYQSYIELKELVLYFTHAAKVGVRHALRSLRKIWCA